MTFRAWLRNLVDMKLTDIVIAAFTVVLAFVAYRQLGEMKRTGDDTHPLAQQAAPQSQAALTQANISQETFDALFRPAIEVSAITFNQKAVNDDGIISYTMKNTGNAPADRLHPHVEASIGHAIVDISPQRVPNELVVGASFTDAPRVTYKAETSELLNGNPELKVSITATYYSPQSKSPIRECSAFVLEPSKRDMIPTGSC